MDFDGSNVDAACCKPDAVPDWYAGAAASFVVKQNEREIAIRFLSEELSTETDPVLVESLTKQLNFSNACPSFRAFDGPLKRVFQSRWEGLLAVEELLDAGLLWKVPSDPYSTGWLIDVDGSGSVCKLPSCSLSRH